MLYVSKVLWWSISLVMETDPGWYWESVACTQVALTMWSLWSGTGQQILFGSPSYWAALFRICTAHLTWGPSSCRSSTGLIAKYHSKHDCLSLLIVYLLFCIIYVPQKFQLPLLYQISYSAVSSQFFSDGLVVSCCWHSVQYTYGNLCSISFQMPSVLWNILLL